MSTIALQRSLKKARAEGYCVGIVERYIKHESFGHRVDLFNLFDAVAIDRVHPGVLGIQACPAGEIEEHVKKIREGYVDKKGKVVLPNPYLEIWKAAGNRAVIWGWSAKVRRDEEGKQVRLKDGSIDRRKIWVCEEVVL